MTERAELWVTRLGRVPYREAVAIQEGLRARRQAGELPDTLLLLEHPPVYTKGRRTTAADLPMEDGWYRDRGIDVQSTDRGGSVTYHGPGQLVGYPIMGVEGVREFVATMERGLIAALADEGIAAEVREGLTGVWVEDRKIGAIGLRVAGGVSMHGFAVNVENDLAPFGWVQPCGIEQARVTSVALETGRHGGLSCFAKRAAFRFAEGFGRRQRVVPAARLLGAPAGAPGAARRLESIPA